MLEPSHNNELPTIPGKRYFTIGEVAKELGVATSLIRFWESQFDFIKPKKNSKGNRKFTQDDLKINGHAIEVRINAEKLPNFAPCPGKITQYHAPGGLGVRMDSALYDGYSIPPYYDSLIGKLIVHGRDRPEALARLHRALGELIVDGVETTVPLFDYLLAEPDIQTGDYDIHWLERWLEKNLSA